MSKMISNFVNKMNLIVYSNLKRSVKSCRSYFSNSQNGLREFNNQLSKFNRNDGDYESKINAARLIALAIQCDDKLSLSNRYLSERNREMILYNVTGGKNLRFKICYNTYLNLASKSMLTDSHLLRVSIFAYLIEQFISAYIILDDISDKGELRRNKLPWYKKVGSGQAAHDAALLLHGVPIVLNQIYPDYSSYARCIEILNEIGMWMAAQGQILDTCIGDTFDNKDPRYFNMETYEDIAFGQMTGNCFYCPLMIAMIMANYDYSEVYDKLQNILNEMGFRMKMENDYNDRYGNKTGKLLDEDIRNGRLTWMFLKAMEHANSDQKQILMECYGKGNTQSTQTVIDVYEEINMKEVANAFRKQINKNIQKNIRELPDVRLQSSLIYALEAIDKWY